MPNGKAAPSAMANAKQDAQQEFSEFGWRLSGRDRAVLLPGRDAPPEEFLDEDHFLRDHIVDFGVIGRQFERGVDEHAPAALLIRDRSLDDLVKKRGSPEMAAIARGGKPDRGHWLRGNKPTPDGTAIACRRMRCIGWRR
jgi:hypothetical protein